MIRIKKRVTDNLTFFLTHAVGCILIALQVPSARRKPVVEETVTKQRTIVYIGLLQSVGIFLRKDGRCEQEPRRTNVHGEEILGILPWENIMSPNI